MTNKAIIDFGFRCIILHPQPHSIIAKFKPSSDNRPRPQRNFTLLGVLQSCGILVRNIFIVTVGDKVLVFSRILLNLNLLLPGP